MNRGRLRSGVSAAVLCGALVGAPTARAGNVLAEISVRHDARPGAYHGELFVFPEDVREYSDATFYGYNFRHELPDGVVRTLEVDRAHTPGAYLMATDLFANGKLSTMSHTVLMVFPRDEAPLLDPYRLEREPAGDLALRAPDGSRLLLDPVTGGVMPSADFSLAPPGHPGTPPALHHRGAHLEIHAVGRSPFLRDTRATFVDASGRSCTLTTSEIFSYGGKPESDVFRFDSDAPFFGYLKGRCPGLTLPASRPVVTLASREPAAAPAKPPSANPRARAASPARSGGLIDLLVRLLSK